MSYSDVTGDDLPGLDDLCGSFRRAMARAEKVDRRSEDRNDLNAHRKRRDQAIRLRNQGVTLLGKPLR